MAAGQPCTIVQIRQPLAPFCRGDFVRVQHRGSLVGRVTSVSGQRRQWPGPGNRTKPTPLCCKWRSILAGQECGLGSLVLPRRICRNMIWDRARYLPQSQSHSTRKINEVLVTTSQRCMCITFDGDTNICSYRLNF